MRTAKEVDNPQMPQSLRTRSPCKFLQKGDCKKGDIWDLSHGNGSAAPATDSAKKDARKEKRASIKAAKVATAVETGAEPSAAGPNPLSDSS